VTGGAAPTVAAALDEATRRLRDAGVSDPRRDATALLAIVLGTDRGGVVARRPDALSPDAAARMAELIGARASRKPLQHIEGRAEFFGLTLTVTEDVLIPRPETEGLVRAVLDAGLYDTARVADLGTGSGCIALALAAARPGWRLTAVDASRAALAVARANALRHGAADRIEFVESDFGAPERWAIGAFDAVISNPPYVAEDEWRGLDPEVRDHEPKGALVPGPAGTEAYAAIALAAFAVLAAGGLLALELGWKSEASVRAIVTEAGFQQIDVRPDVHGIPRVLTARK
jgi:release factor glutamine methyltransferase